MGGPLRSGRTFGRTFEEGEIVEKGEDQEVEEEGEEGEEGGGGSKSSVPGPT